jgi:excisionase family DNA binding protein
MALVTLRAGYTVPEAAKIAGVGARTILRWIESNELDALAVHPKMFFVPPDALERCLARRAEKVGA